VSPAGGSVVRALLLGSILLVSGCASQPPAETRADSRAGSRWYDYNTLRVPEDAEIFQKGYGSAVLHCEGSFTDETGETYRFNLRGIVSPLDMGGQRYFLGAGHVFDLEKEIALRGAAAEGVGIHSPAYYVDAGGERFLMDRVDDGTHDLALFVQKGGGRFPGSRYRCGDSDDLRLGNPVLCWGMPLMEDFELSVGIVSALAAPRSLLEAGFPEANAEDFFVSSMPTIFGCSGGLVYAFRNGTPEIVGMLVAGYVGISRSLVYKINAVLRDAGIISRGGEGGR
jgi:hypothetical protein